MISCPVCDIEKDVEPGKYICSKCKSKFEYLPNGEISLIKREKFDFWIFFYALFLPLGVIALLIKQVFFFEKSFSDFLLLGVYFLLYPFLISIKQVYYRDKISFIALYYDYFSKRLSRHDNGRMIGFYIVFIFNIIGLFFILLGAFV